MSDVRHASKAELIDLYCERDGATTDDIVSALQVIESGRTVLGWFLLECGMLDSSRLGERTLVPYGPGCTFQRVPGHPVSPRGLASDMATVIAYCGPGPIECGQYWRTGGSFSIVRCVRPAGHDGGHSEVSE